MSRLGRQATLLALLAGALGYAWAIVVVGPAALRAMSKPPAEDQKPYPIPDSSSHGDLVEVSRRLDGWPTVSGKGARKRCWSGSALWTDSPPLVRGSGPKNGTTAIFWIGGTFNGEHAVGRYATDLWYVSQAGTGAIGFATLVAGGDNTRLIERIPPPKPGPPGWHTILAGQCVWGPAKLLDDDGTVGRFLVDLPANTDIHENCGSEGKRIRFDCRVTIDGREALHVPFEGALDDAFYYRTVQAGRYGLIVRRTDPPDEWKPEDAERTRFHLIVTWGTGGGEHGCSAPSFESNCLGEPNDE